MHMGVCVCEGQSWMWGVLFSTLLPWDTVSFWNRSSWFWQHWLASKLSGSTCWHPPMLGYSHTLFLYEFEGFEFILAEQVLLPTEPSPQSPLWSLKLLYLLRSVMVMKFSDHEWMGQPKTLIGMWKVSSGKKRSVIGLNLIAAVRTVAFFKKSL